MNPRKITFLMVAALSLIIGATVSTTAGQQNQSGLKLPKEICREAKAAAAHIAAAELAGQLGAGQDLVLLDIRTQAEYEAGHIAGAIWFPRGFLEFKIQDFVQDPEAVIVVYCLKGCRSSQAVLTLNALGYSNVRDLEGGLAVWINEGFALFNQLGQVQVTELSNASPFEPEQRNSQ